MQIMCVDCHASHECMTTPECCEVQKCHLTSIPVQVPRKHTLSISMSFTRRTNPNSSPDDRPRPNHRLHPPDLLLHHRRAPHPPRPHRLPRHNNHTPLHSTCHVPLVHRHPHSLGPRRRLPIPQFHPRAPRRGRPPIVHPALRPRAARRAAGRQQRACGPDVSRARPVDARGRVVALSDFGRECD